MYECVRPKNLTQTNVVYMAKYNCITWFCRVSSNQPRIECVRVCICVCACVIVSHVYPKLVNQQTIKNNSYCDNFKQLVCVCVRFFENIDFPVSLHLHLDGAFIVFVSSGTESQQYLIVEKCNQWYIYIYYHIAITTHPLSRRTIKLHLLYIICIYNTNTKNLSGKTPANLRRIDREPNIIIYTHT